jgi:hypothetical protein
MSLLEEAKEEISRARESEDQATRRGGGNVADK